jgi:hypothetical protein
MGGAGVCLRTFVNFYQTIRRHVLEDSRLHRLGHFEFETLSVAIIFYSVISLMRLVEWGLVA